MAPDGSFHREQMHARCVPWPLLPATCPVGAESAANVRGLLQIVEHPNEDFAVSSARLLLFSTYQLALYRALTELAFG